MAHIKLQPMIHSIHTLFSRPFPFENDPARRFWMSFLFGVSIATFLLVLEPFGLQRYTSPWKTFQLAGYGLITFVWMMFNHFALPVLFPSAFQEERWTVGSYIAFTLWNIMTIAVTNSVYAMYLFSFGLSWKLLFRFFFFTLFPAIPLVTILTFVLERRYLKRNLTEATRISASIEKAHHLHHIPSIDEPSSPSASLAPPIIKLTGSGAKERYELQAASILCVQASDNYVTVYYHTNHSAENRSTSGVKTILLRATLKSIEEQMLEAQDLTTFVRCHKSFIVNCAMVERVTGNAQGYKLHLSALDFAIPVSRSLQKTVLEKLG
jgi:DNA-binding LytR/AlgR family response regulator